MKLGSYVTAMAVMASFVAAPVLADPGNGKGNGKRQKGGEHRRGEVDRHRNVVVVGHCPPGLAKKDPACVPPGQARKHRADRDRDDYRDYRRVGEVIRVREYTVIRDVDRYGWDERDGWDYYRDGDRAYRVDRDTRKILAVMELIDAFN
ncbi:hypothetical protein [Paracoccus xiamenensis]|uniref:hypothetical protein n=1 Tax=Paracoccus xiamenensis TaxID=2714901 RepID=UPI00140810B5|nr:hypothetical protein [Paracoccus xiamenensis]NHF74310.1 hypothetical protein [Paracoccus xiamenensis]